MAEDFYVDPVECMGCGYPPVLAPDLMEFAKGAEGYLAMPLRPTAT